MIDPKAPPAAISRISASTSSVPLASPPEKMTTRAVEADCTTWRMRSRGCDGDPGLLVDLLRLGLLDGAFGGFTLMMCAPSCAEICAA
jgi:hypothetical protein